MTLGQIVDSLDKEIVLEHVIPVIVRIPSREPGVLMGILGINLIYNIIIIYNIAAAVFYSATFIVNSTCTYKGMCLG